MSCGCRLLLPGSIVRVAATAAASEPIVQELGDQPCCVLCRRRQLPLPVPGQSAPWLPFAAIVLCRGPCSIVVIEVPRKLRPCHPARYGGGTQDARTRRRCRHRVLHYKSAVAIPEHCSSLVPAVSCSHQCTLSREQQLLNSIEHLHTVLSRCVHPTSLIFLLFLA